MPTISSLRSGVVVDWHCALGAPFPFQPHAQSPLCRSETTARRGRRAESSASRGLPVLPRLVSQPLAQAAERRAFGSSHTHELAIQRPIYPISMRQRGLHTVLAVQRGARFRPEDEDHDFVNSVG
ncbi:hypothetical protein B0H14DRAFT_3490716 [Mycena olivaceomarginata]|nr:hypothetical protein B0H14DRAFT_3490716 [Mycena olivaceomarginata]